jgi:hypothetical protein
MSNEGWTRLFGVIAWVVTVLPVVLIGLLIWVLIHFISKHW